MITISNKFKRQIDDWIEKGICTRHKYINSIFRFMYRALKKSAIFLILLFFFILGLIFSKSIWNSNEHK